MKLETFFEKFDQFADARDAVAKMRGLLIHFAVSGNLAPNDQRERPVALSLSGPPPDEAGLPSNWRCGLLGDAFTFEYGDNLPAPKRTETGEYPVYGSNGIVGTHDTYLTKEPAIIVGRKGSAGALNIAEGPSWTTDVAYFVRPPKDLDLRFTYYLFSTLHLDELGKGIKPGLSRKEAYALPIALPPLAEQKRIVAKVDELTALCDRLEAQQQEREVRHAALARASLARFAEAPTPANLEFIFHKSYDITPADLRKSILTLAVQGKLVPQDPNDEPAELLLARLMSRDTLASGRRKKSQPDLSFTADEIPFELPPGWAWERLGNMGETNIGLTYSPQDVSEIGIPVLRSGNIQNGKLDFDDLIRVKCKPKQSVMVQDGDLLICARNGSRALVGKVAVIENLNEPAAFGAFMAIYRSEVNQYLYHFIRSPLFRQMIDEVNTTTINQITQNNLRSTLAPIPPLAEQRRIVAKVDQLMALVDKLETQLAHSRAIAANLLDAVVAELTTRDTGEFPLKGRKRQLVSDNRMSVG